MSVPRSQAIWRNAREHHARAAALTTFNPGFTHKAHTTPTHHDLYSERIRAVRFGIILMDPVRGGTTSEISRRLLSGKTSKKAAA